MPKSAEPRVRVRVHLASSPERVYALLATDRGRESFWCARSSERDGVVRLRFGNGQEHAASVLEADPPRRFAVTYFGGSVARFELAGDGAAGTLLTLEETGIPPAELPDQRAGWVSVLLALKAAADHGVDLRNHDPARRWEQGFVDV